MALWVTFWGTRGSIPVSLDSASIRDKLAHAIVAASGKRLDTQEKARAWVDSELDFAVSHTFGGNSACVQLDAGDDEYVLRSEEHTSELQSLTNLVCRLLLEKKKKQTA